VWSRPVSVGTVVAWLSLGTALAGAEATLVSATTDSIRGEDRIVQWTTAQGLPQNTVTDIVLLPSGELWLATFGGLARFDGLGFHVLDMAADPGLPANRVVALAATGRDSFVFLTQQGHLGRVAGGRSTLLVPPPLVGIDTLALVLDATGRAFCQSADGAVWQTDGTRAWQPVLGPRGTGARQHLALDEDGDVWVAWGARLVKVSGGLPGEALTLPEPVVVLAPRAGGGLWLGLHGGVGRLVDGRFERLDVRPALEQEVSAIEPAGRDALWVVAGDVSRLERQAGGSWSRRALPLGLPSDLRLRSLRLGREGSLWIGTGGDGLYRVHRLPVRRFGAASSLRDVGALARDGAGGAFAASGCRGLFHVEGSGTIRPVPLPRRSHGGREPPCGISLDPAPDDSVWVRSGSSLFRLRRSRLDLELVTDALPFDEGPIAANPDGTVWVASRDGSVRLLSSQGRVLREVGLPAPLMSASLGPDRSLWLGGDGEVFRVGAEAVDRIGPAANVPRGLVRDVRAEPDGTVWIGTYGGGVGRLRAGRVVRFTADQGLPDNAVSRILDDGRGRMWISTNRGIAVVARAELDAVADGRARALDAVVLGTERGVAEANFGSPAGFAGADGRLWFGTIAGAVSVDAGAFPFNAAPPNVRIEEIRADDRPLPLGPTVRVPPLTGRLRLSFSAVSPLHPERMRFRFRVEGLDADWVDAGATRTVDWSPPGPGRHRFLVEARNEDGVWSSAPAEAILDVRPAWWQATAFRIAVALALALVAAAGVRLRIRGIERRHAGRLRVLEEQRLAEERMTSLRLQLEHASRAALAGELAASLAHEVRQPIGAMVNNAEAGRRNLAQYLQRPAELEQILGDIVADGLRASEVVEGLRGFLRSSGPEAAALDLSSVVREILPLVRRELQDNRVEVELALAEALPPVEGIRVQLGQVVVNLLVNACEALSGTDGDRRVTISTAERDGRVELAVRDNGPGLDPAVAERVFEPFVTTKKEGLGVGLAICRSIAERHGGHLSADAPPGGGLRMALSLPAAHSREARP